MSRFSVMHATRKWTIAAIAPLALTGLMIVPSYASTSYAAPSSAQVKPTIVLVHGAWADASGWSGVVQRLQADGYTADAPPNLLRGLVGDAAYIANFLATVKGSIVLVGHSYGGMVITNAATGNANVKALVYIDAFIPNQGESTFQLTAAQPGSYLENDPTKIFNFVHLPGAPKGADDLYLKPQAFISHFASGVAPQEAAILESAQRPLTLSAGSAKSGVPAWKTIPSWSLIGTRDEFIPPAELRIMATRAHAHVTEVAAGHLSLVSNPGEVTSIIEQAAQATSK